MIVALFLAFLPQDAPTARLAFRPEEAVLGQPVELVLDVTHAEDDAFVQAALEPEPDPSWVVFGSRRELVSDAADGRRVARRIWEIASLEPGPRRAPAAFREALEATGVVLVGLEPLLDVVGVLAEGEDEPRGLRGFPASLGFAGAGEGGFPWPLLAVLSLPLFLVGWLLLRRRGGSAQPVAAPLERLASLRSEEDPREAHFALSRLVREVTDARLGDARAGLTDEEWLTITRASAELPAEAAEELTRLYARFAAVKYAGERPTDWAVDEAFSDARRALELLDTGGEGTT